MKQNQTTMVVEKLLKLMEDRNLSKAAFAELIGFEESKWNKISNRRQSLSVEELSKIATRLDMREIDIYTYPKKFLDPDDIPVLSQPERISVTFEVSPDKRDILLNLVTKS